MFLFALSTKWKIRLADAEACTVDLGMKRWTIRSINRDAIRKIKKNARSSGLLIPSYHADKSYSCGCPHFEKNPNKWISSQTCGRCNRKHIFIWAYNREYGKLIQFLFFFFFYYSLSSIFMKTFFLWPLMTLTSTQTCAVTNEWHWFFMTPCCYSIFILIRILLWFYYFQIRCWKMKHQPNRIWLRQCTPCDRKIMHRTMRCRMIGRVSLPLARVCCTPIFRRKTSHPVSQVSDFCYSLFLFFRSVCLWQEKIIKILHPFLFLQSITTTTKRCVKFTLHRSQPVIYGLHIVCISIAVISLIYVADIHNTKLDNNNKKYKMCMNIIEKAHSENHVTILKYSIWNTEIFSCILK